MTDTRKAQLGVEVDSGPAEAGLDRVAQKGVAMGRAVSEAGQQAAKGMDAIPEAGNRAAEGFDRAEGRLRAAMERSARELKLVGASLSQRYESEIAFKGYDPAKFEPTLNALRGVEAAQRAAAEAAKKEAAALADVERKAREAATAEAKRAAELARQQAANDNFVKSLQDQAATLGFSQTEMLRYRASQMGLSKEVEASIQKIEAYNKAQAAAAAGLGRTGISAGQLNAALRGVPAQFTDIVTSLQGGQALLTVFLQQGGQLRDMFGGAGTAARALGGYVLGLVNPFTVAAAAAGLLAFAYSKGAAEQEGYVRGLLLSGNAAGATASQLGSAAAAVSALGGTQARAAEVLTTLATDGRVAADSLQRVAAAAIALERAGGPAAEETAKAFAALGKDPLAAALKLNDATNFLTAAKLQQIKALEDEGRKAEAAKVAQEAYFDAITNRTPKLEANLGALEKAWRAVKDAAGGTWDAMLGIGRAQTLEQQIAALEQRIARARSGNNIAQTAFVAGGQGFQPIAINTRAGEGLAADERQLAILKAQNAERQKAAEADADRKRQTEAASEFEKIVEQSLGKQQRLDLEIVRIRNIGVAAGRSEVEIQAQITAAKERAAGAGSSDGEAASLRARIVETRAYLQALGQLGLKAQELNEGEKAAQTLREQLKGTLDATTRAAKQQALAEAERLGTLLRTVDGEEKRLKGVQAAQSEYDKLIQRTGQEADAIKEQAAAQEAANAVYGKGKAAIEEMRLAQMQSLAVDLEKTDNVDPRFIANLNAKIEAQRRYVASLKEADFNALNRGAEEWLRNATEAARLQAEEGAQATMTAAERERLAATRAVELKLAKEIDQVNKAALTTEERAAVVAKLRAAAAKDLETAASKANTSSLKELNDFLDPARAESFGDALTRAFAGAGNSLVSLTNALGSYARQQAEVAKQQRNVENLTDPAERMRQQMRLNERSAQNQIGLYASLTGSAKGFFAEGSRGYKALQGAETAFRLVQLAGDLQRGLSAAAVGIATQASGDPYTAVPRMAAMAAIMASLGFAIGFSGGGSSGGGDGAKQATGTGTVLGDSAAKSESISRSIESLAGTAKLQLSTQSGMLASLRNIENSIGGLSGLVLRSGVGADGASRFNVNTGTTVPLINSGPLNLTLAGAAVGGPLGALAGFAISQIPIVDKIVAALFGTKTKITGQGLAAGSQALGGIVAGGLSLQDYVDVQVKKSFLGITYSNKNSTQYQAADPTLTQQFGQVFRDFYSAISAASGPLGLALGDVQQRLDSFIVDIGKIDLGGLDGEKLQEKLSAVLGAEADKIAGAAIPGLTAFQKVGEGYFETVVRVASGVEQARASLDLLGVSAVSFGDVLRKQGDVATEIVRESIARVESSAGSLSSVGQMLSNLDGTAEELAATYRSLIDVRDVLQSLGQSGEALTPALIGGAGGLDKLQASLQTYQQAFLSDQERAQIALAQVGKEFARIGIESVPQSSAQFKTLVGGIDTTTAAGQKLYAQVLGLAGSFDEAQKLAEKAGLSVVAAASRLPDILKSQATTRAGLEVDVLTAKGDTAGAAALKRAQELAELTAGLSEAEAAAAVAGYDYLASLRQQITGYNDARAAAQAAAVAEQQRIEGIASQRQSLEDRLLQATGDTAAIRQRELDALDASNRSILERIYALEDEQAAAAQASQAAQAEADRLQAIASERSSLETQVLQLLGDTAALRARELAALDPSNRAIQQRIYDLQDEQAAQQKAAQLAEEQARAAADAANEQARALQQLRDAWQGITDSIYDEVSRLRQLATGGSSQTLAAAQANFTIGLAQSRAGDQDAARNLPALSQALLAVAEKQVADFGELQRLRLRLAAQLESVGQQVSLQYGLTIPRLATGTNRVPADMLAVIHRGEAVVPAPFNPANGGGFGSADVVDAINGLRAEQKAQALAIVTTQRDVAKLLKAWNADGMPDTRVEVTV